MKVGVIGAGAWGTALAITVARGGSDVVLWSFDGLIKEFDGVELPHNVHITTDMSDLHACDCWLIVTPAAFFRETLGRAREFYNRVPVIICTKGAEYSTGKFMSEVLQEQLPECTEYGVLSGPQFAAEVAAGVPTGSTLAGTPLACRIGSQALNKLYISQSDDIIGTEICGVGKNAVALICGYNSVVCGENERAMIFTRVWNEVASVGIASGARIQTFLDLCGIGDLFLTATSPTSRNFSGGMAIARGEEISGTVEGIFALAGIIERGRTLGVDVPVLREMKEKMKI